LAITLIPINQRTVDKTCNHLKGGKCTIYDDRPKLCRDFEVGSKKCFIAMKGKNPELYNELSNKLK